MARISSIELPDNTEYDIAVKYPNIKFIKSQTFTGVLGTANDFANATFYFGSIKPTAWDEVWEIKYHIKVYVPNQTGYFMEADVRIAGDHDVVRAYASYNRVSAYYPAYYHEVYRLKEAGYTSGYGHALGIRLQSAYNPTTAGFERTVEIEIYNEQNCSFTFFDECLKYANIPGTGSTNYNTYTEINFVSNGLQEIGDANDPNYQNRIYYTYRKTYTVLYRYQILLTKSPGYLLPINTVNNDLGTTKTLTTESFDPFGEIYYYNSQTTINADANIGNAVLYRQFLADLRFSFNIVRDGVQDTLEYNNPIFLVCVPQSDGSAKLHSNPIVMDLPTTNDGLMYIFLGMVYNETHPYRTELLLHHPVYMYIDGQVRQVQNYARNAGDSATVNGHTVDVNVPADANLASVYSSSAVYSIGDYALNEGILYICNTDIDSPGETWNINHWDKVMVTNTILKNAKDAPLVAGGILLNDIQNNIAGTNSIAEGVHTTASGEGSHAEGGYSTASGQGSHAEGDTTTASGRRSHSEGVGTSASGSTSHAEGQATVASGTLSHSEGNHTTASGTASHAEGNYTEASGTFAHTNGEYTIANHRNQIAFGAYNIADDSQEASTAKGNYIEIVGNGESENSRSNARTLDWSGNETLTGSSTATSFKISTDAIISYDSIEDAIMFTFT